MMDLRWIRRANRRRGSRRHKRRDYYKVVYYYKVGHWYRSRRTVIRLDNRQPHAHVVFAYKDCYLVVRFDGRGRQLGQAVRAESLPSARAVRDRINRKLRRRG